MYNMNKRQTSHLNNWQESILLKYPGLAEQIKNLFGEEGSAEFDEILRTYLELLYGSLMLGFAYDLGWLCREVVGISTEETAIITENIDAHVKRQIMLDLDECLTAVKTLLLNWEEVMVRRGHRQAKQEVKEDVLSIPDNQIRFPFD